MASGPRHDYDNFDQHDNHVDDHHHDSCAGVDDNVNSPGSDDDNISSAPSYDNDCAS